MNNRVERVHVVFKTHLDIGFTDLAQNVTARYMSLFIPKALESAAELERSNGTERLVWTTGAWLVDEYLRRSSGPELERFETALHRGSIVWHGMPFTTHSELMDPWLADAGLAISSRLDARFGKKTIAAKLTDVPGHCIGLVPIMARRGIKYLHIGVNGGSRMPKVPKLFRWQAFDGSEVIVHYSGGYGDDLVLPGLSDALVIATSQDNQGPPHPVEIRSIFKQIAERFPGARIMASTLDAFAASLLPLQESLPVLTDEIGDTWIHGAASDPYKITRYRELLRLRRMWSSQGVFNEDSEACRDFARNLLLVAEHTWGLDFKKHLGDYRNWSKAEFECARKKDHIDKDAVPEKLRFMDDYAHREFIHLYPDDGEERWGKRSYSFFESSHAEQRTYIDKALDALPEALRLEAVESFTHLKPERIIDCGNIISAGSSIRVGAYLAIFAKDGSVTSLRYATCKDGRPGKELLLKSCGIGVLRYQTFGPEDYKFLHRNYNRDMDKNSGWVLPDFGKPGMERARPRPEKNLHAPVISKLQIIRGPIADEVSAEMRFAEKICRNEGAPRLLAIRYRFPYKTDEPLSVVVDWFDKDATRLPEALWISFGLAVRHAERWRVIKLGIDIDPKAVVRGGNRSYHAVSSVTYNADDGVRSIEPFDSFLVSPGKRKLIRFDDVFAKLSGGMHFVLYDNLWGTNFPLWYGEEARFRFAVRFG